MGWFGGGGAGLWWRLWWGARVRAGLGGAGWAAGRVVVFGWKSLPLLSRLLSNGSSLSHHRGAATLLLGSSCVS